MNLEVSITAAYNEEEQEISLNLEGEDMGILIGKRGQTLDSLQYLVSLIVNKGTEGYLRVNWIRKITVKEEKRLWKPLQRTLHTR